MKFCVTLLILLVANGCYGILNRDLYGYVNMPGSSMLQRGDEESKLVKLNAPIFFYTEKYDSVYVSLMIKMIFTAKVKWSPSVLNRPH